MRGRDYYRDENGFYAPSPRFATPRDPDAPNDGAAIAKLSEIQGKPFMPHQRLIVDVGTERTPLGLYKYSIVLVTLPRQSGKTTLVGPVQEHRIITRPNIKAFFTAQTGKDARARFNDLTKLVIASPLAPLFKVRRSIGSESLSLANGSSLNVFSPTPSSIHGETPHLVTLDEIWAHDEVRGNELLGAIGPAQITLGGHAQIWMISTQGTALSGFLNELVQMGVAGTPGMAYFDWSMADGLDPYDPKTWWTFHPALGNTITEKDLAKEAKLQPAAEWMRAYMNRRTEAVNPVMTPEAWAQLAATKQEVPSRRDLAITYEVAPDNECAVVMASWRDSNGNPNTRVIHAAPGTAWLVPLVLWLKRNWKPAVLGADDGGPTRRITDELRRELGDDAIFTTGARDFATACEALLTYARDDKTLIHDGSLSLSHSMAHLALRPMGEALRFSRQHSTGPIAALIAAAVGIYAFDHQDRPIGLPVIHA